MTPAVGCRRLMRKSEPQCSVGLKDCDEKFAWAPGKILQNARLVTLNLRPSTPTRRPLGALNSPRQPEGPELQAGKLAKCFAQVGVCGGLGGR